MVEEFEAIQIQRAFVYRIACLATFPTVTSLGTILHNYTMHKACKQELAD